MRYPQFSFNFFSPTSKNLAGYMSLTYSITGLLVILGLFGKHMLAADVAIVQGAVLATFYVLSGDARHLILTDQSSAKHVMFFRLIWLFPLAVISYYLASITGHINESILCGLIIRRSSEWLAEIHVTEMERKNIIWDGWVLQPILFFLLTAQIILTNDFWFIWLWAISPVVLSFKFILQAKPHKFWNTGFENITSTAIIGFTGYTQRVLIVALVGKEFSGMIFPGFAIGSFIGSMVANVAGPTLLRKKMLYSTKITIAILIMLILGAVIFFITDTVLYKTAGLSIAGGGLMIVAQQSRLTHLKDNHTLVLDLLFQISLVFSILAIYFLFDEKAMMTFYLVGSAIAYIYYKWTLFMIENFKFKKILFIIISLGLIFPIFFQLDGKIYNNELVAMVDSGGNLKTLPLPFSLLACYIGVVLFGVRYEKSKPAIIAISAMFLLLITSTIFSSQGVSKFLLLAQFILPITALLLGSSIDSSWRKLFAKVSLYFLCIFVPFQLIATWFQGSLALTHYLYLFSIYSHYQFVPLMIATLYAWTWVELRNTHTKWLGYLTPWIAMYMAAGNSILALVGLILFACCFAFFKRNSKTIVLIPLIVIVTILGYFYLNSKLAGSITKHQNDNFICKSGLYNQGPNSPCKPGVFNGKLFDWNGQFLYSNLNATAIEVPVNLKDRIAISSIYFNEINKEPLSIFFGHSATINRNVASSAHNYYLDLIYSFGIFSCFPLIILLLYTSIKAYQQNGNDRALLWLLGIIIYLVVFDNNFKVSLRQPYPGILTFFLWGILLGAIKPIGKLKPV